MKREALFVFLLTILASSFSFGQNEYITVWKTNNAGVSGNNQITIPAVGVSFHIYWEKFSNASINGTLTGNGPTTITFPTADTYRVKITPGTGTFNRIVFNGAGDRLKILKIEQWGNIAWSSMLNAYNTCTNLKISAQDIPNLSNVFVMSGMFNTCTSLATVPNIKNWNTSSVVSMSSLFSGASVFNDTLDTWNTANVANMSEMFAGAANFNNPIGSWNTANVTDMSGMFSYTNAFNQPIGSWNTGNVVNMSDMFNNAHAFNQPIGSWNTSNVTQMSNVFLGANVFNQPIGNWNTANVTNMGAMFEQAVAFNQDLGNWNTSNVTQMVGMFMDAESFNGDVSGWNVGNVTDMTSVFSNAYAFNQPIGNWNTSNVTNFSYMFAAAHSFNADITGWNTANAHDMSSMFLQAFAFNQNIALWNTQNVYNVASMFMDAYSFNRDLSAMNFINCTGFLEMLDNSGMDCMNYDKTIKGWNNSPNIPNNKYIGADNLFYWQATAARDSMINQKGWTFIGDFYAPCNYPLSVQLTKFDAQCFNNYVQLSWETASEINSAYFVAERSQDGSNWSVITTVKGAGSSQKTLFYQTIDYAPLNGSSFYRLKKVDFDGTFTYSPVRKINRNNGSNDIALYPNPVKDRSVIEVNVKGVASVFNIYGREIMKINVIPGRNSIDFSSLSPGVYFINMGDVAQYKFVKE